MVTITMTLRLCYTIKVNRGYVRRAELVLIHLLIKLKTI